MLEPEILCVCVGGGRTGSSRRSRLSVFKGMQLHCDTNNVDHHTSEASQDQLIVRRGQSFRLTLELSQAFNQQLHPLTITATTGWFP